MKKYKYLFIFGIVLILGLVFAETITTFSNGSSSENLFFTGNSNISRNISIPLNALVTNATMNLSNHRPILLSIGTSDINLTTLGYPLSRFINDTSKILTLTGTTADLTYYNSSCPDGCSLGYAYSFYLPGSYTEINLHWYTSFFIL